MKYFPLILLALFIDGLQALLMLFFVALEAVTPVGGGIGAAGLCYSAGSGVLTALQCAVVGAGASAFAVPLGMVVDVGMSVIFGGGLILLLAWLGMFYPGTMLGTFLGESIPFLDILPGWTLMTWRCIHRKNKADKKAAQSKAPSAVAFQQPQTPLAFDGIRAANDNQPYAQAA